MHLTQMRVKGIVFHMREWVIGLGLIVVWAVLNLVPRSFWKEAWEMFQEWRES